MRISEFIKKNIIIPRLQQNRVLVVYDTLNRYFEICNEVSDEEYPMINASESSILSRQEAMRTFQNLSSQGHDLKGMIIYIPTKPPLTVDEKQRDPFSVYSACGAVFPDPQNDGDEYKSLCLKAKPEYVSQIQRVFDNDPNPSFAVIDAIGGGKGWPTLQALLRAESAKNILLALLAPDKWQKQALESQTSWISEAKSLFLTTLGMRLITKIKSWSAITDELWRYLLFSEFVFDLPGELPKSLGNVPKASQESRRIVFDLCDALRNDLRTRAEYVERANEIQETLNLSRLCEGITELGRRDTFAFEEQVCFGNAVKALVDDDYDSLHASIRQHQDSVWRDFGTSKVKWDLLDAASALIDACHGVEELIEKHTKSISELTDFYTERFSEVDRLYRSFEQASSGIFDDTDQIKLIRDQAQKTYLKTASKLQNSFLKLIENVGWPIPDMMANIDAFDHQVAPSLQQSGRKIAVFQVDALRYELGAEMITYLEDYGKVSLKAACAQLPTITSVGMVSLLPDANQKLSIDSDESGTVITWEDKPITSVKHRMGILAKRYGQRFQSMRLDDLIKNSQTIEQTVELLVLRTNEMDSDFEANPEAAPSLISRTLNKIRAGMKKLQDLGFKEAYIMTDHGFFLNPAINQNQACSKPTGNWESIHNRMLLGSGDADPYNLVMPVEKLGIKSDFEQAAIPRALVSYSSGEVYFHGGLSLQEAIVPIISVMIKQSEPQKIEKISIVLDYRQGRKKITTRLPVINIGTSGQGELFAAQKPIEFLLEAHSPEGDIIGEAKPGDVVNPATRTIKINPGENLQVTLKMDPHYEGEFILKALDPTTSVALGEPLKLETDFIV